MAINYKRVTDREYFRITGCSSGDFTLPKFTIDEVQDFLESLGYRITVYTATARIDEVEHDGGEVRRTGKMWDDEREVILALRDGDILPPRVDSDECSELNFLSVFKREMKKKLLNL